MGVSLSKDGNSSWGRDTERVIRGGKIESSQDDEIKQVQEVIESIKKE